MARRIGREPGYFARRCREHKEFLNSLKTGPCGDCEESFPAVCMEFDHVTSGKLRDVSQMKHYRRSLVEQELQRCELVCANCHRVRTDGRRPARKINGRREAFRTWIASLKEAPCKDCKECFPAVAMDFDHVRGVKICGIAQMWSWGRAKVLVELAKCELVCANCHRLRTISRQAAA